MILGINGSPNKDGLSVQLLDEALESCQKEGSETKLIHLMDFNLTNDYGDYKKTPEGFEEILSLMKEADGVVLASPTHWFGVSSLMKSFLDKLSFYEYPDFIFEGKVAGVIASCEEDGATQACMQMIVCLNHLGFLTPPYGMVIVNKQIKNSSEGAWMEKDLKLLGKNMVELAKATKNSNWDY